MTEGYNFRRQASLEHARKTVRTVPSQGEPEGVADGSVVHTTGQLSAEGEVKREMMDSVIAGFPFGRQMAAPCLCLPPFAWLILVLPELSSNFDLLLCAGPFVFRLWTRCLVSGLPVSA